MVYGIDSIKSGVSGTKLHDELSMFILRLRSIGCSHVCQKLDRQQAGTGSVKY